jgi:uncharacterized membrane protein
LRDVTDVLKRNVHTPLYFYFMHYWIRWFGTSEAAVRFPSAVFGIVSVFIIFLLGRELFNPFVGLFSAALLGLMPEQIYQSTNGRMYSLLVLLALASTYVLARSLRTCPPTLMYLVYGFISAAGLYTHYVYLFCFAAQTLYVWALCLKRREIRLPWAITQLSVVALLVPWLLISWAQKQTSGEALSWVGGGLNAWETLQAVVNQIALLTSVPEAPLGTLWQFAAFILLLFGIRSLSHAHPSLLLLLALWAVTPVVGILAADILGGTKTVTVTRYWMVMSPALYLFISVGAQPLSKMFGEVVLVSTLVVLLGVAGVYTAHGSLRQKPYDFKRLAHEVESQIRDEDKEVILTEGSAAIPLALAYYGRRDTQIWRINLKLGEPGEQEFIEMMRSLSGKLNAVWLLSNRTDGAAASLVKAGFRLDDAQGQSWSENVRRYVPELSHGE